MANASSWVTNVRTNRIDKLRAPFPLLRVRRTLVTPAGVGVAARVG
jgi:hypothetical protein